MRIRNKILSVLLCFLLLTGLLSSCGDSINSDVSSGAESEVSSSVSEINEDVTPSENGSEDVSSEEHGSSSKPDIKTIPPYSGKAYTVLNGNKPIFSSSELSKVGYEKYSPLDSLGRCGAAVASVGLDTMPGKGEERGSISSIKPSGWVQAQYDNVSGKYLYNRCHLIGWQLSAENANKCNLITGTRYLNTEGMLPFENMVADYIKETGNHVAYRVTPIFEGNNLLANGVQIEAFSVEDNGDGVCFNVYCYNVQNGVTIDYKTGKSSGKTVAVSSSSSKTSSASSSSKSQGVTVPDKDETGGNLVWVPTKGGTKYHNNPNCSNMDNPRHVSIETAVADGYTPCKKCYK